MYVYRERHIYDTWYAHIHICSCWIVELSWTPSDVCRLPLSSHLRMCIVCPTVHLWFLLTGCSFPRYPLVRLVSELYVWNYNSFRAYTWHCIYMYVYLYLFICTCLSYAHICVCTYVLQVMFSDVAINCASHVEYYFQQILACFVTCARFGCMHIFIHMHREIQKWHHESLWFQGWRSQASAESICQHMQHRQHMLAYASSYEYFYTR